MKMTERAIVLRFFAGICLICLFTVGVFPVFVGNYSEFAFREGRSGRNARTRTMVLTEYNQQVRDYVALAAVHLLQAKTKFNDTLQMLEAYSEISNINFSEQVLNGGECAPSFPTDQKICENIECAIHHVNDAINIYVLLVNFTDVAPSDPLYSQLYNTDFITILKSFPTMDFFNFYLGNDSGWDEAICLEIASLLADGDVNGIYRRLLSESQELLFRLDCLKGYIQCGQLPPNSTILERMHDEDAIIPQFWSINTKFAWISMFGQHVSEVFYFIKNNYGDIGPGHWHLKYNK